MADATATAPLQGEMDLKEDEAPKEDEASKTWTAARTKVWNRLVSNSSEKSGSKKTLPQEVVETWDRAEKRLNTVSQSKFYAKLVERQASLEPLNKTVRSEDLPIWEQEAAPIRNELSIDLFTQKQFTEENLSLVASYETNSDVAFLREILLSKKERAAALMGFVRETINHVESHPKAITGDVKSCSFMIHAIRYSGLIPMFTPEVATLLEAMTATNGSKKPVVSKETENTSGAAVVDPSDAAPGTSEDGTAPGTAEDGAAEVDEKLADEIEKDTSPNSKASRELAFLLAVGIIALLDGGETEYNKTCLVTEGTKLLFCFYQFFDHPSIRLMKPKPDGTSSVPMRVHFLVDLDDQLVVDVQHESFKNVIEKLHSLVKTKVALPQYAHLNEDYQFVFEKLLWRIGRAAGKEQSAKKSTQPKRKKPPTPASDSADATAAVSADSAAAPRKRARNNASGSEAPKSRADKLEEELQKLREEKQSDEQSFLDRLSDLDQQVELLKDENKSLKDENKSLKDENERLKKENALLEARMARTQEFADAYIESEIRLNCRLPTWYESQEGKVSVNDLMKYVEKQYNNPSPSPPPNADGGS